MVENRLLRKVAGLRGKIKRKLEETTCWPLVPEIAGSLPDEAIGFFGRKNPQHAFLRK
jgi:hypothetical protein